MARAFGPVNFDVYTGAGAVNTPVIGGKTKNKNICPTNIFFFFVFTKLSVHSSGSI